MCPSTPATGTTAVSMAHLTQPTFHFCEVATAIRADCGCVVSIWTTFSQKSSLLPHSWRPTTWTLATRCPAHADIPRAQPIELKLSLLPSTAKGQTEPTITGDVARRAAMTS
jgi:hypothetical protein